MADGGGQVVTQEAARHLEVAHTLGEHAARIGGLENRVERELSEIRASLQRMEAHRAAPVVAAAAPDPNLMLIAQSLNRFADQKVAPQQSDLQQIAQFIQTNGSGAKRESNQVALIVSLLFNGGLLVWAMRAAIFGG